MADSERGMTLVEVLVVLVILGLMGAVAGLGARGVGPPPDVDETAALVAAARREAIATGKSVTITLIVDGKPVDLTAWPDGFVRADIVIRVHPLTGRRLGSQ